VAALTAGGLEPSCESRADRGDCRRATSPGAGPRPAFDPPGILPEPPPRVGCAACDARADAEAA